jgi:hypothetical protein
MPHQPTPQDCDSKRIVAVQVYQPKLALWTFHNTRRRNIVVRWYHAFFVVVLLLQTTYMLTTMGEPYRQFLAKADREGFQGMCSRCV